MKRHDATRSQKANLETKLGVIKYYKTLLKLKMSSISSRSNSQILKISVFFVVFLDGDDAA